MGNELPILQVLKKKLPSGTLWIPDGNFKSSN